MQAGAQHREFGFGHCSLQSQKQPVIKGSGIIQAICIQDEGASQRTDLQQVLPIGGTACQAGDVQTQPQPHLPQPHVGDAPLKADAIHR